MNSEDKEIILPSVSWATRIKLLWGEFYHMHFPGIKTIFFSLVKVIIVAAVFSAYIFFSDSIIAFFLQRVFGYGIAS